MDLTSGTTERTYKEYVPAGYDALPAPLVVDLHGYQSGATIEVAMTDLGAVADESGFVLATPQGNGPLPYWNAVPHDSLPDDVRFVSDVIDDVGTRRCIDPRRVYVVGFSNGAFLASLVGCRLAGKVAAVAAVSGLLMPEGCDPSRPVPVMAVHGTADRFVSFTGTPNAALETLTWNDESREAFSGLRFAPVTTTVATWAAANGCDTSPTERATSPHVRAITYGRCDAGASVVLDVVDGGGHTWPSSEFSQASESILGPTTFELDASTSIWSFFRAHPMPG